MADTARLVNIIKTKGLKRGYVASKLCIDRSTLWKKLTNQSEFTANEIAALSELLELSRADRDGIFFG